MSELQASGGGVGGGRGGAYLHIHRSAHTEWKQRCRVKSKPTQNMKGFLFPWKKNSDEQRFVLSV